MTDPDTRLLDRGTELERQLLRAGRSERVSDRTLQKTLLAVGIGSAVLGASAAAGSAVAGGGAALKAGASTSLGMIALKWLGIGAVGGLVTMSSIEYVISRNEPAVSVSTPSVTAPAVAPAEPLAPKKAPQNAERAAAAAPSVAPRAHPSVAPSSAPSSDDSSIAAELADIDAARAALNAGDTATTLARLDACERRPGRHVLGQEALFLRMEALFRAGQRAQAEDAARKLLGASPNGPHAARARLLLEGQSEKK